MKRKFANIVGMLIMWAIFVHSAKTAQTSQESKPEETNDRRSEIVQEVTDAEATACGIELARKFTDDPAGFLISNLTKEEILRQIGLRLAQGQLSTATSHQMIQMVNHPAFFFRVQRAYRSTMERGLAGSQCTFIGLKKSPQGTKIILRNLVGNGVQYYSFTCHRQKDGSVGVRDAEAFHTGGPIANTLVNGLEVLLPKPAMDDSDDVLQELQTIGGLAQEGKYQEIVEHMRSTGFHGKNYEIDIAYLAALSALIRDDDHLDQEYVEAVSAFKKNWSDRRSNMIVEIMSLDVYRILGEEEKFLETIQSVREKVCNDPYLTFLVAAYYMDKSSEKALEYAWRAKSEGLQVKDLWFLILSLELERGTDVKELAPLFEEAGELFGEEVEQELRYFVEPYQTDLDEPYEPYEPVILKQI